MSHRFSERDSDAGCIPANEPLETAHVKRTIEHAAEFRLNVPGRQIDWGTTLARKQAVVDKLVGGVGQLLKSRKVAVFVVIAEGSLPLTIPGYDVDGEIAMTSDEFLSMDPLPKSAVVIGGGAIGREFASTMSDMAPRSPSSRRCPRSWPVAMPTSPEPCSSRSRSATSTSRPACMLPATSPRTVAAPPSASVRARPSSSSSRCRRPNTDDLGLDGTKVQLTDRGFVGVDDRCRTGQPGVWSVGDCFATPALAHVAFAEGSVVIKDILGENPVPVDYGNVPWAVYCNPEVAFAGMSEEAAKEAGYDVVTSKHRWTSNGRAIIVGDTEGLVKIVVEKQGDGTGGRMLGVHLCGPWATEQLGRSYLAVNWEGTVKEVAHFIQPQPTLSELFCESVLAMTRRGLHG